MMMIDERKVKKIPPREKNSKCERAFEPENESNENGRKLSKAPANNNSMHQK